MAKFSEVLTIVNGKNQKSVENPKGKYPIYGSGGVMGYADDYICNANTIIIGRKGNINNPIYVETPFWNVDTAFGLDADENKLFPKYLYYFCVRFDFEKLNTTVTIPSLTKQNLLKIEIPLPPLETQKQIAANLDKVTHTIDLCNNILEKLDLLVKSRFVEMFGDAENKIPISEMCNVTGGYSFKSGDISNDGAIKILQIGNVYLDNVSWETVNYLPEGYDEKYSKFLLNEGDIVVALTRPIIQSLGNVKACIVKSSDLPCLLNQRVGRIVAKNEKAVFLEFIYGCLMTDDFTKYVESCSIGCSQPNISTKDIESYLIPNATYEEQKTFVEFKTQTDKSKSAVKKVLEKAETLKKALMQEYFG